MTGHRRARRQGVDARTTTINIRVSVAERDELRARAAQAELSVGAFMVDRSLVRVTAADLAREQMAARRREFEADSP
jgi:hypothetical protein